MPRIVIESDRLAKRGRAFNNLLGPLLKSKRAGLAWHQWPLNHGSFAITAYHGSRTLNFNEARFSTYLSNFTAQYYEIWVPVNQRKMEQWYLNRAYLNIFNKSKEYVCLHCDPEEDQNDASTKACYKQSPHIHIKIEHQSVSKSHIAIAHGFLDQVYSSYQDFFTSIRNGVELISDEILNRYIE